MVFVSAGAFCNKVAKLSATDEKRIIVESQKLIGSHDACCSNVTIAAMCIECRSNGRCATTTVRWKCHINFHSAEDEIKLCVPNRELK